MHLPVRLSKGTRKRVIQREVKRQCKKGRQTEQLLVQRYRKLELEHADHVTYLSESENISV